MGEGAEGGRQDLQEREEALHLGPVGLGFLLVGEFVHGDDLDLVGIDERNLTAVVGDACGRMEREGVSSAKSEAQKPIWRISCKEIENE